MHTPKCLRVFPVLLVISCILMTYHAYLIPFREAKNFSLNAYIMFLVFYHFFYTMLIWCYFATMCTATSKVPWPYKLPPEVVEVLNTAKSEKDFNEIIVDYCLQHRIRLWTRTEAGYIR